MNTNDEKIQWHPAFDAALQIEFGEEAEYLEFDSVQYFSTQFKKITGITPSQYAAVIKMKNWHFDSLK